MEKPILFNTEMVQAILQGRKTQTRRVIKPQPDWFDCGIMNNKNTPMRALDVGIADIEIKPPYQVGDTLWVRETWKKYEKRIGKGEGCHIAEFYGYKADEGNSNNPSEFYDGKWHPSIHMPKKAARLFLKVTDVSVQRVQDITGKDVLAEGVDNGKSNQTMGERWENMQCQAYQDLWDSLYDKKGQGWAANPWVWVIEFERLEG